MVGEPQPMNEKFAKRQNGGNFPRDRGEHLPGSFEIFMIFVAIFSLFEFFRGSSEKPPGTYRWRSPLPLVLV